jgi:tetratricopeptide (TPR) repeat protein
VLLERAGGNPLYAEEFVRLLADRGGVAETEEVPDSVQALIAARLDTLERVEDLADVLAHHHLTARELARAAGDRAQAEELALPARRFLALAGERALGLDTAQAEARLAHALELCPPEDAERPELLLRWADAALQAGRPREAATALDEALPAFRAHGHTEGEARALILLSRVTFRLSEDSRGVIAEAVRLLEAREPAPALVEAYEELSGNQFLAGAYGEAIATAGRAIALAERLGVPVPARALGRRGDARAYLGDSDGIAEMERALALLVAQGEGQAAASLQNNLAIARYPLEGPARSLAAFEQGIAFCEQRGLADSAAWLEADCPGLLVELGRPEEALKWAGRLAAAVEASGTTHLLIWVRALELATCLARGETQMPGSADWLIETARAAGTAAVIVEALAAAAAARLSAGLHDQARTLLAELEQVPGARETSYYARRLAGMLRVDGIQACAGGDRGATCADGGSSTDHKVGVTDRETYVDPKLILRRVIAAAAAFATLLVAGFFGFLFVGHNSAEEAFYGALGAFTRPISSAIHRAAVSARSLRRPRSPSTWCTRPRWGSSRSPPLSLPGRPRWRRHREAVLRLGNRL